MQNISDKTATTVTVILLLASAGILFTWSDPFLNAVDEWKKIGQSFSGQPAAVGRPSAGAVGTSTEKANPTDNKIYLFEDMGVPYIEVVNSCDHNYVGDCVEVYTGPGEDFATTTSLRTGIVMEVTEVVEQGTEQWYKLTFGEQWLRYPERVTEDWYVRSTDVELFYATGTLTSWEDGATSTNKRIVIDKSEQKLFAYEGDELFMQTTVSTGLELSPTTEGIFEVFKKTPNRYMQGPIEGMPVSDYYDLVGVPWNLYFTDDGEVIHGTYWHDSFGQRYSHGCVNLSPQVAKQLYQWAVLGTTVEVHQ